MSDSERIVQVTVQDNATSTLQQIVQAWAALRQELNDQTPTAEQVKAAFSGLVPELEAAGSSIETVRQYAASLGADLEGLGGGASAASEALSQTGAAGEQAAQGLEAASEASQQLATDQGSLSGDLATTNTELTQVASSAEQAAVGHRSVAGAASEASASTKEAESAFSGATEKLVEFENVAQLAEGNVGGLANALAELPTPIAATAAAGIALTQAFADEQRASTQLETSLKDNVPGFEEYKGALESAASAAVDLGFSHDAALGALNRIVNQTHDATESIHVLSVAEDVAKGTSMGLDESSAMVVRAMEGQGRAFKAWGLDIKSGADAMTTLAEIEKHFAGQAQADANTIAGVEDRIIAKLKEFAGEWGPTLLSPISFISKAMGDALLGTIKPATTAQEQFAALANEFHVGGTAAQGAAAQMQAWGGSMAGFDASTATADSVLTQLLSTSQQARDYFAAMGVSVTDSSGQMRDAASIFADYQDKVGSSAEGAAQDVAQADAQITNSTTQMSAQSRAALDQFHQAMFGTPPAAQQMSDAISSMVGTVSDDMQTMVDNGTQAASGFMSTLVDTITGGTGDVSNAADGVVSAADKTGDMQAVGVKQGTAHVTNTANTILGGVGAVSGAATVLANSSNKSDVTAGVGNNMGVALVQTFATVAEQGVNAVLAQATSAFNSAMAAMGGHGISTSHVSFGASGKSFSGGPPGGLLGQVGSVVAGSIQDHMGQKGGGDVINGGMIADAALGDAGAVVDQSIIDAQKAAEDAQNKAVEAANKAEAAAKKAGGGGGKGKKGGGGGKGGSGSGSNAADKSLETVQNDLAAAEDLAIKEKVKAATDAATTAQNAYNQAVNAYQEEVNKSQLAVAKLDQEQRNDAGLQSTLIALKAKKDDFAQMQQESAQKTHDLNVKLHDEQDILTELKREEATALQPLQDNIDAAKQKLTDMQAAASAWRDGMTHEIEAVDEQLYQLDQQETQALQPLQDAIYDQGLAVQNWQDKLTAVGEAFDKKILPKQKELDNLMRANTVHDQANQMKDLDQTVANLTARLHNATQGSLEYKQIQQQLAEAEYQRNEKSKEFALNNQIGDLEAQKKAAQESIQAQLDKQQAILKAEQAQEASQQRMYDLQKRNLDEEKSNLEHQQKLYDQQERDKEANAQKNVDNAQKQYDAEQKLEEARQKATQDDIAQTQAEINKEQWAEGQREYYAQQEINQLQAKADSYTTYYDEQKQLLQSHIADVQLDEKTFEAQTKPQVDALKDTATALNDAYQKWKDQQSVQKDAQKIQDDMTTAIQKGADVTKLSMTPAVKDLIAAVGGPQGLSSVTKDFLDNVFERWVQEMDPMKDGSFQSDFIAAWNELKPNSNKDLYDRSLHDMGNATQVLMFGLKEWWQKAQQWVQDYIDKIDSASTKAQNAFPGSGTNGGGQPPRGSAMTFGGGGGGRTLPAGVAGANGDPAYLTGSSQVVYIAQQINNFNISPTFPGVTTLPKSAQEWRPYMRELGIAFKWELLRGH